jgi:hypothetical protein
MNSPVLRKQKVKQMQILYLFKIYFNIAFRRQFISLNLAS